MDAHAGARLQQHSRWLTRVADAMLLGTIAVLTVPVLVATSRASAAQVIGGAVISYWLVAVPYLLAVFAIRRGFAAYAQGGVLGRLMARACRHAGAALAVGAAFSAFGAPLLLRLWARPVPHTGGTLMVFDAAYIAIGVVGLALVLLGGLLDRALDEQQRLQRVERELTEFV